MALVLCEIADGLARLSEGARYELDHTEGRGPEMQDRLDRMRKR